MNTQHTFLQRNSIRALIAAGLVWGCVTFLPSGFFAPAQAVLAPVVAPFQGFFSWVAFETSNFFQFFSSVSGLKQENERLARENQVLVHEATLLSEVREENRRLREAFQLPKTEAGQSLSAEVISRDTSGTSFSLTLNRGSLDGVRSGLPVIVGTGQLVGRVAAVHLTSCTVFLLSHPESTIAARIAGTSIQGVIRGDHGLGLIFDMALSGEKLEPGARLVTSGLDDELPKELSIGEIGAVRPSADRLFQQAVVVTPAAESDIRFVTIVIVPAS
ncbi:MAG: rod shape-determining protein MreC [Candidatus Moraniibacteriota bacterium]|nr:MAG: rod shape-determining protein MreC [Candidatus Moranbacteria bacterium]